MNIAVGLSGLKAAADLTKALRDGMKSGNIKAGEITGRIGEIYDYIIDSKASLVDAKEEIDQLKAELKAVTDDKTLRDSLEFDGKVYWIAKGEKWDGPFCAICWDHNKKLNRLDHQRLCRNNTSDVAVWCFVHKEGFYTKDRPNVITDLPPLRRLSD